MEMVTLKDKIYLGRICGDYYFNLKIVLTLMRGKIKLALGSWSDKIPC